MTPVAPGSVANAFLNPPHPRADAFRVQIARTLDARARAEEST